MHAWIAGGTGLIGKALVSLLLEQPSVRRVTSLVRRTTGARHDKLEERVVSFERLATEVGDDTSGASDGPEVFFCCLGTTMAKAGSKAAFRKVDYEFPLALAEVAGRRRAEAFLIVTAMGANPHSAFFYNRVKGELETDLDRLGLRRLRIFRPSLLLGERSERRPGEDVGAVLARPLGKLMVGPLRKYRPIRGDTVARAMLRVALAGGDERVRVYASDAIEEIGSEGAEAR